MKKIICTLGPNSLNKTFLNFSRRNIDLLRLNMSHIDIQDLEKKIKFIRRYTNTPICIDTEGAQIRTKCLKTRKLKIGDLLKISQDSKHFHFYPECVFHKLKKNDILEIGFNDLKVKIVYSNRKFKTLLVINTGKLENNKGVHLSNRKISLNYLTDKDNQALKIGKKLNIKHFALSFTNSVSDIKKFNIALPKQNKIFKIETKNAITSFKKIVKEGKFFLIDRGDLSKDVKIENIPIIQRQLVKSCLKAGKKLYIATNLLETMVENLTPNRGEANDIYSILEMGAHGLVLAAETAVGKYPKECVIFLKKMVKIFMSNKR